MGKVQILINQKLVDLRAGEIQKLMKMRRAKRPGFRSISREEIKTGILDSKKRKS
jgi:hypothetical protein